jgi:hypothetical protein
MQAKSDENWRVGQRCLDDGDINVACSRLYYAVMQAVLTWARAQKDVKPDEREIHGKLYRLVAGEGKARVVNGPTFKRLRALRDTADYERDPPDEDELRACLPRGEAMRTEYFRKAKGHE